MRCSSRVYIRAFIIFIVHNDLPNVCKSTNPVLYGDDANLFINDKIIIDLQKTFNSDLAEISTRLKIDKLSLDVKKTHHMIFTNKTQIQPSVPLSIEEYPIDEVDNTKFLGISLDIWNKLENASFIYIRENCSWCWVHNKSKKNVDQWCFADFISFCVSPYLSYCIHIWGCTYPTNLKQLVVQQKIIIRIIAGMKYRDPTESAFKYLNVIKFLDIKKYLTARFMYQYHHNKLPVIFSDYFRQTADVH